MFNNFIKKPGAEKKAALHACQILNVNPPSDYLDALRFSNGGEGFIRYSYFRLYSITELILLNDAYQVKKFAPRLVIFGSNGGGEAFGFDTRADPLEIVQIPFIPMDFKYAKLLGRNFMEFLSFLEEAKNDDDSSLPHINMSAVGKEVHEIHPIIFGGNPIDDKNKVLVPSEEHAKLSVFWNEVYLEKVSNDRIISNSPTPSSETRRDSPTGNKE
ncbi:MAG: SMI1/KNR4 family protein [Anaerolineae bacterium]|nr:SMI1/KNR4 family protein [Anaerolineae bacterium]MCI0608626.1 SMI1/KNR4 family protein [Anaerolineae bacterium]